jgi:sugar O-acyltransferase (sialic acid O-acetyltransferase NeuD family)
MRKDIIIIGAGGQAKNIVLLIEQIGGWNILGLIDDDLKKKGQKVKGYEVLGPTKEFFENQDDIHIVFSIGDGKIIEEKVQWLKSLSKNFKFPNLIHPSASLNENEVKLGEGNIVNTNVVFTTEIEIGSFNYFNRCCSISHDVFIGDYCFIHAGVHLSGESKVGNRVWFGVNSTIVQVLTVGDDAMIGAGAVILKNVEPKAVMVGNPAKLLRFKE